MRRTTSPTTYEKEFYEEYLGLQKGDSENIGKYNVLFLEFIYFFIGMHSIYIGDMVGAIIIMSNLLTILLFFYLKMIPEFVSRSFIYIGISGLLLLGFSIKAANIFL